MSNKIAGDGAKQPKKYRIIPSWMLVVQGGENQSFRRSF
jgi:hypothetical protein